jgi:UTP--glucose-1-phosphate uridylyltransferase
MLDAFAESQSSIVAVQKISPADSEKYGVIDLMPDNQRLSRIWGIVEKPRPENAPSNLGVVGRYILTPSIFPFLEKTVKGGGAEIQLTDAIANLLLEEPVYSYQFEGKRYDCGSKLGYLQATVSCASKHPDLAQDFNLWLKEFIELIVSLLRNRLPS